ncbi:DMT family transporter [Arthrobacter sp. 35W]|uniref:DMT family transporter n=1 Tax=Arthrobacter sp. 35W TaxID=1132441 RepID=UPI00047A724C|nr:DMT family transporter [Arthrobacter sp. 35W]
MSNPRVLLAGLAVVVLWASAFPAIQVAAPAMGVVGLSVVRLAVAAGALLVLAPFLGVRRPAVRDLPLIAACGFFGMAAYQILLNWGELYVPAGTASIVVAAAPLVSVAIAAGALGERLTGWKVAGSLVALAGVVLVCLARSGLQISGPVWIVVGAMLVQGIYHPLTKPLLKRYTGLEVATYAMVAGLVVVLPTLAVLPESMAQLSAAGPGAWAGAVYLGLLPSALGFVLWGYAVARLPMAVSTSLLYLVSPVAVLVAFLWLGELPHPAELLGGLVVVAGVVLVSGRFGRRPVASSHGRPQLRSHS